jgi:ribosomal protein L7Ae-like RNA K-turn-binding protein
MKISKRRCADLRNKLMSFLGIIMKSGNLVLGTHKTVKAVLKNTVYLVLVCNDVSKNSRKLVENIIFESHAECVFWDCSMDAVSQSIRRRTGVIGILNVGMAEKVKKMLEKSDENSTYINSGKIGRICSI